MRCTYQPESEAFWFDHYMKGSGMAAFAGLPYQRGSGIGSIFKSLFRLIAPLAKKLAPTIAGEVLGIGGEIARNVSEGKPWRKQAQARAKRAGGYMLEQSGKHLQSGSGICKRPKRKSIKVGSKRPRNVLEEYV